MRKVTARPAAQSGSSCFFTSYVRIHSRHGSIRVAAFQAASRVLWPLNELREARASASAACPQGLALARTPLPSLAQLRA
jgi:hypothetical protein